MVEKLHDALNKHFEKHRLVLWYDPDGKNRETAESYAGSGVDLVEVANNEFAVKHRILKERPDAQALVYIPSTRPQDEQNWLLDVALSHFVFSTNQAAWVVDELGVDRDLEEVVQNHLAFFENKRDRLEPLRSALQKRTNQPDADALKLAMISVLVSDTKGERQSNKDVPGIALKLFRDTAVPADQQRGYVEDVERYGLTKTLWRHLSSEFGFTSNEHTVENLLAHLFRQGLHHEVGTGAGPVTRRAYTFLDSWRNNVNFANDFEILAERFGKELNVRQALTDLTLDALLEIDLFKETDRRIVHTLIHRAAADTISARDGYQSVLRRGGSYWVSRDTEGPVRLYYDCLREFFQFQMAAVDAGNPGSSPADIWNVYRERLYKVDGHYRRFLEFHERINDSAVLKPLLSAIEAKYVNDVLQSLSEAWGDTFSALAELTDQTAAPQREFFPKVLAPYLAEDKVVFVIVSDAMRYEVGVELSGLLETENRVQVSLEAWRSAVPTYTQLGMTALLPHGALSVNPDSLLVSNDGKTIQGTDARDALLGEYFASNYPGKKARALSAQVFEEMTVAQQEEEIQGYDCVYLFSNRIDAVGDNAKTELGLPGAVRKEINALRALVKRILNLNRTHVVITADHGFLFQYGPVEESDMVQVPSDPGILHKDRRFVLGEGLRDDARFLRASAQEARLEGDYDIYLAKGLARIRKQGSGTRYVHGGASIHELCIPVIRLRKAREDDVQSVHFVMLSKATDITTNSISLEFLQTQPVGPKTRPRRITARFESADGGEIISNQRELVLESEDPNDQNRRLTLDFVFTPGSSKQSGKLVYLTFYEDRYGQPVQVEDRIGFRFRTVITPDF